LSSGLSGSSSSGTVCVLWDTFTDADRSLTGHIADTGQTWVASASDPALNIVSNHVENTDFFNIRTNHIDSGLLIGDDRRGTADFTTGQAAIGSMGILLLGNVSSSYWWLKADFDTGEVTIVEVIGGTQFGRSSTAKTFSPNTLYAVEFSFIGTMVQLTVGGTNTSYSSGNVRYDVFDGVRIKPIMFASNHHKIDNLCIKKV